MSGVYIPGVQMPRNCHDCRFCGWSNFWQAYNCHMTKNHALLLFNGEKTNSDSRIRNGRADSCPLVPVPPHGRLIDADALQVEMMEMVSLGIYGEEDCIDAVIEAPTVIQADKEG